MAKGQATAPQPEVTIEPIDPQTVEPFKRDLAQRLNREEAARELIWRANSELVERLLSIMNDKDDPGLSEIDNKRRRYARILWAMSEYFHAIGRDKLPALGTYIGSLGVALGPHQGRYRSAICDERVQTRPHAHLGCPAPSGPRLGMLDPKRPTAREGSKSRSETLPGAGESDARHKPRPKGLVALLVRPLRRGAGPGAGAAGGVPNDAPRPQGGQPLAGEIPKRGQGSLREGRQIGNPISFNQIPMFG